MAFRFSPRQLGLYGKRRNSAENGKGEAYEPKNTVTSGEISRMENSRVTPYRHKQSRFDPLPEEAFARVNAEEALKEQAAEEAHRDAEVRAAAAIAAEAVEQSSPTGYMHEVNQEKRPMPWSGGYTGASWPEGKGGTEANASLGTDADGKLIFKEDVISLIQNEMERRRRERLPLELQWQLNSNFYDGNQYCDINITAQEILPYSDCAREDGGQHEVFNRIAPLIETRVANLKKIHYSMEVRPATNEADDYQKAKVASAVLRHTQSTSGFNAKKDALVLWNELCGSCFWLSWWDPNKGSEYVRFKEEYVDGDGSATRERVIYEGDVDYGLLTPYEVYPESIFKQTVADQRSIIIEQVKTVDEIESLYGIRVKGTEVDSFTLTPVPAAGGLGYEATVISMGKAKMGNSQRVYTYFERRSKAFPDGRMAILVGDSDLVYYGPLPYDEIPIVRTVCKERAGQFFGKSVIEDLIPLQRAYNTACNDIADYLKEAKSFQYLVFEGSVDIDDFEENAGRPGAILTYKNYPELPPVRQSSVAFSADVFSQKHDLEGQMEYVAAVSQLMVYGQTPSGVTSGTAIESLRDIDNTRLALTGDYIRNAVLEMARIWLGMYKRYAAAFRVIKYTGANELGAALVWNSDDITSYDVEFSTENELLRSETSQWQRVLQILQSPAADRRIAAEAAERAREFIKSGAYNSEQTINELQSQAAARENTMLEHGALPYVSDYDNHALHAEEHLRYILQTKFEALKQEKPAFAEAMVAHWKEHEARLRQNTEKSQERKELN
ncbi:MAG: hypothetical protein J1F63_04915 [Oscillospiraceae bacterium]|nr:hypothetical protein [Oscillospiraceae bacterium]